MKNKTGVAIALVLAGALVGRWTVEPQVIEGPPPPPKVITETETIIETVYEDREVTVTEEVIVEVQTLPSQCSNALDDASMIHEYLSDYEEALGKIDRLLEELSLGVMDPDIHDIVKAETELRLTHNESLAASQALADTKVTLERNIGLCNRELER